ncbi:hypothetical protein HMPREF3227_02498 [Corynebacterium sp. CMW7794]|nr:hypothetical protein HMPREF3227_02498 [Corynebacterium sp. CMW7794]
MFDFLPAAHVNKFLIIEDKADDVAIIQFGFFCDAGGFQSIEDCTLAAWCDLGK